MSTVDDYRRREREARAALAKIQREEKERAAALARTQREEKERTAAIALQRERAERAERAEIERLRMERIERESEMRRQREQKAMAQLELLLGGPRFAVTQEDLDALLPHEEQGVLRERIRRHVREWFSERTARLEGKLPDEAQLDVISRIDGNLLVQARAGSGKTRALTYRAMFLMEACSVSADEILLLAFNKKAAQEIADRLEGMGCATPHVMTFHALSVAINRPRAAIVTDDDDDQGFSHLRNTLAAIVRRLEDEPTFSAQLQSFMLEATRRPPDDYSTRTLCLSGIWTDGYEDALLLDFFFEHGVNAEYGVTDAHGATGMRTVAEFSVAGRDFQAAFWGSSRSTLPDLSTTESAAVEIQFSPLSAGMDRRTAFALWRTEAEAAGLVLRPLSEEQIWARVHERLRREFIKLTSSYVMRMRSQGKTVLERHAWVDGYRASDATEARFVALAEHVCREYETQIEAARFTDFQQVIMEACAAVDAGRLSWRREERTGNIRRLRHLMVDEFQDVSPLFMRLIEAIRTRNSQVALMGVGDDWQAINGFAGATTGFFKRFEVHFPNAVTLALPTNHRSCPAIVEIGNAIMLGRGLPAVASQLRNGELLLADIAEFRPVADEKSEFKSRLMPALRRLVAANVEGGRTVVLLSRTREPVSGHKQKWAELCSVGLPFDAIGRVSGSTVHKFKGKEAHTVIIVDASARSFPKLSPVWTLFRIFGDSIASLVEDERQLLYVAATRAADNVICVVDTGRKNGDLSELFGEGGERFTPVDWTSLPMPRRDGRRSCLVVVSNLQTRSGRRGGTHAVKEQLKMASFTYSTEGGPQWSRSEPLDEDGGVEQILRRIRIEDWAIKGDGLVIELLIGRENSLGMYTVIEGHWTEL